MIHIIFDELKMERVCHKLQIITQETRKNKAESIEIIKKS